MKILFIAYYFEPFEGVGAKRISYWAKNLKRVNSSIEQCDVITATKQNRNSVYEYIDNIYYIETSKYSLFGKVFKVDLGASWLKNLKKFTKENIKKNSYDYVIITGNPFLHFFIIGEYKQLGIQTILDFRDPFATNPRGIKLDSTVKKFKNYILKRIEKYFIKNANYIITVNQYCVILLQDHAKFKDKIYIIDNGYDEQLLKLVDAKKIEKRLPLKICYAGKLYKDRNPLNFLDVINKQDNFIFHHIGEESEYLVDVYEEKVIKHGVKSYMETLNIIGEMEIAIIFTSGYTFESTTKIFDYIALDRIILIITDGEMETGSIHDITKNYPQVYWAKNNTIDIEITLQNIKNNTQSIQYDDKYLYSREYGLSKLISLMK